MRSGRGKWDSNPGVPGNGYSSSEDDEMTRLKPNSGTSTSGSHSSGPRRARPAPNTNYLHHSNSEGATSPNESDNTYAEATLLQPNNPRPIRYGDLAGNGYDSEIYANDQLVNNGKYQPRSPPNSRYLGTQAEATSSPFTTRTTGRNNRKMDLPAPPLPASNGSRPRQMVLAEAATTPRGWDNGVGGYQTNSILETRIGGTQEDYMKHFTMMGPDRRNRQTAFGAKTASLHRRSLSDDSLKHSQPNSPSQQQLGQDPIVMPGFPVRTLQTHPPPPYSPSREKILLGKRCRFHCSWKLVALSLTVLTLILSSVIAYFGAIKFPGNTQHPVRQDSTVISAASSSATNGLECPPTLQEQPQAVIPQGYTPEVIGTSPKPPKRPKQPPIEVIAGQWYTSSIEPMEMWFSKLSISSPNTNFQMNLTVLNGQVASLAIYGRREAVPSITNYDWVHMVARDGRIVKRGTGGGSESGITVEKRLNYRGTWYFGVLNDNTDLITVRSVVGQQRNGGKPCPGECNGQGRCEDGVCQCYPQFSGHDCSQSVCPLLCSGHGVYGGGKCHCVDGWKGPECQVRITECIIADCSGNGRCREGVCLCDAGWNGEHCQKRDCEDPNCTGHGVCQDATCICDIGWMGPNCELRNEVLYQCLPDCSGHGMFNADLGKCMCHSQWTGRNCNITVCGLDCGLHGQCLDDACVCSPGWQGPRCNLKACSERCKGQCINGSCICHHGFNGQHCGIDACGPHCNSHGVCENLSEEDQRPQYECQCQPGWAGEHCQIPEEMDCEDEMDNDNNGLTDCGDSKCCSHKSCRNSIMCMYLEDPVDVLLRKPPPAVAAPFLKRVQFLFEGEDSVQNYAKQDTFEDRRVSIIRGRVVTMTGQGIIGVRVSVDRANNANNYGFTLTRPGGWFDMAVNGGGGVTLQFQRSPLKATTRTLYLPWNRIVVINSIIMTPHGGAGISWNEEDTSAKVKYTQPCYDHNYKTVKPIILSSYIPHLASAHPKISPGLVTELQEAQETIRIPGTSNLHLVYRSRNALSTIDMILSSSQIPNSLIRIHVIVRVAGNVFETKLEPDTNLRHTFAWDKRNIYNQKVYGIVDAEVSVGYEYETCSHLVWSAQMVRIKGYDVDISNIGGWNFNIHHHYNPYQGVLQKGDGSLLELNALYPRSKQTFISGPKRDFDCTSGCDVSALSEVNLLNVVSMTSGPDGSLYIGDFNLIRRVMPNGKDVFTIFKFDDTQRAFDYDLTVSPADSQLYLSHAKKHQVWKLKSLEKKDIRSIESNWEAVVGTGERCVPNDLCGDQGPALKAKLNYPKGLAISIDKTMYISDGRNIRVVMPDGVIQTLIGANRAKVGGGPKGPPRPLPCQGVLLADQAQLQWPTKLALNPLDSTLHIVDDTMVLKLMPDMRLVVMAGMSPSCFYQQQSSSSKYNNKTTAANAKFNRPTALGPLMDLKFNHDGMLYLVEKKSKTCLLHQMDRFGHLKVLNEANGSFAAISVSPSGDIYTANNEEMTIHVLKHEFPIKNEDSGEFKVPDHLTREIYTFNRFSQHIATHNLETGVKLYTFGYTKNTALGKLSDVSDEIGNTVSIARDYGGKVQSIDNSLGQKHPVELNTMGQLKMIKTNGQVHLTYDDIELLQLASIHFENGDFRAYAYNSFGLVTSVSSSSGTTLKLETCQTSSLTDDPSMSAVPSHCFKVLSNGDVMRELQVHQSGRVAYTRSSKGDCIPSIETNREEWSVTGLSCSHLRLRASTSHPTLMTAPSNFGSFSQWLSIPKTSMSNLWTWKSDQRLSKQLQLGTQRSNQLFRAEYNAITNEEAFYNGQGQSLLSVSYKSGLLPTQWSSGLGINCSQTFDRIHRLTEQRCGQVVESFGYNNHNGRLEETRKNCQRRPTKFIYAPNSQRPRDLILPSGRRFSYDIPTTTSQEGGSTTTITLPGGTTQIKITIQTGILGLQKIFLDLPGLSEPWVTYWQEGKRLVHIKPPSGNGNILNEYNADGNPLKVIAGDFVSVFEYNQGLLSRVKHTPNAKGWIKTTIVHDWIQNEVERNVQVKEVRVEFEPKTGLASAKFDYVYDLSLAKLRLLGRIGGKSLPDYFLHHGWTSRDSTHGITRTTGQFVILPHDLNMTSVTDGIVTMTSSMTHDSLSIQGRELYRAEYSFDPCGKLTQAYLKMVKGTEFRQTWKYNYDSDGQLETASILDNTEWRYNYDRLGNLVTIATTGIAGRSSHNQNFEYDNFGRFKGSRVTYDYNGFVIGHINGGIISYNSRGNVALINANGNQIEYLYDHNGRLVAKFKNEDISQYFYAHENKPGLLSHVYKPREGSLISLVYDHQDRLIFMSRDTQEFYIVSDRSGSPLLAITPEGIIMKEITRTPYGKVTYDSNRNLDIPIGFHGGIYDDDVQLIHFQDGPDGSRAYDPFTGSFLIPQWKHILLGGGRRDGRISLGGEGGKGYEQPQLLNKASWIQDPLSLLYRYASNDPINAKFNPFQGLGGLEEELQKHLEMAQPSFNLRLLGQFLEFPLGQQHFADGISTTTTTSTEYPNTELVQILANSNVLQVLTQLRHLSWTSNSALKVLAEPFWPSSPLNSPLGKYVSLSIDSVSRQVQIHAVKVLEVGVVEGQQQNNEIPCEVFEKVLNQEAFLALNVQHGDTEAYYFIKPNIYHASNDIKMLHKLGPTVNLTTHESQSSDGTVLMDVKIHLVPKTIVSIRYGGTIEAEKSRILRHTMKVTARRAWQKQKSENLNQWSDPKEQDQLRRKGSVDNYEVRFIRDPLKYPELAADLTNVKFVKKNGNH